MSTVMHRRRPGDRLRAARAHLGRRVRVEVARGGGGHVTYVVEGVLVAVTRPLTGAVADALVIGGPGRCERETLPAGSTPYAISLATVRNISPLLD